MHITRLSKGSTFGPGAAKKRQSVAKSSKSDVFAVEMTLRERVQFRFEASFYAALGAWKPAQNAGFHIPTATASTAVQFDDFKKPRQTQGFTDSRSEPLFGAFVPKVP